MTEPTPDRPTAAEAGTVAAAPETAAPAPASSQPGQPTLLTPVTGGERVEILDVLRGFAIFGILAVNMALFFSPVYLQVLNQPVVGGPLDELARKLIVLLAQGKFYSLFSFLFGMGLAIQMERAAARGRKVGGFFAKRMTWLLLIGLAHAFLLWFGDILVLYSLLGFALLLFRKATTRTLWVAVGALLTVPILLALSNWALGGGDQPGVREMFEGLVESAMLAYQTGSWDEIFIARTFEWLMSFPFALLGFSWMILALFVLGLDFGRRRFFQRLEDHATAIRRWSLPLLVVGIGLNLLLVYFGERYDPLAPDLYYLAYNVCLVIAPPILSAAYVATLCLLWLRPAGRRLLHPMAPVGRMALTNYLMHSLVFTTVSYSYGFGLYGEISYLEGLGLTVLMFAVQIPLSAWWLRHYRFGPMEWLWRTLSYGRMQPMRR